MAKAIYVYKLASILFDLKFWEDFIEIAQEIMPGQKK
jgi:hypothetical protein